MPTGSRRSWSSRPTWTPSLPTSRWWRTRSPSGAAGSCDAKGLAAAMVAAAERLAAAGRAADRAALPGRRGERLRRRPGGGRFRPPRPVPHQRRADREPPVRRAEGHASGGPRRDRPGGPLGLSGGGLQRDRGAAGHHRADPPDAACRSDPLLGPSTLNLGLIDGGVAPNVIPPFASAQLLVRTVEPTGPLKGDDRASCSRPASASRFPSSSPSTRPAERRPDGTRPS